MLPLTTYKTPDHAAASSTSADITHRATPYKDRFMLSIPPAHRNALLTSNTPTTPYQHHLFNTLLGPNRSEIIPPHVQVPLAKSWNVYVETILDSGNITDDFYMTPLDWRHGYLLHGDSNKLFIQDLTKGYQKKTKPSCMNTSNEGDSQSISSLAWNPGKPNAIVGYNLSRSASISSVTQIWDCTTQQKLVERTCPYKIYALTWKDEDQFTASIDNIVVHADIRMQKSASNMYHSSITRSLSWNDNNHLAIGSDEGNVKLYDMRKTQTAFFTYTHNTPVKALQWNPVDSSILATGGGLSDRCITIANIAQQELLLTKKIGNQVCDLKWFDRSHVVLGLGFPNINNIRVESWNRKNTLQTVLCKNQEKDQRVLSVATSPQKTSFATLSKDYIMIHRLKEFKPYRPTAIR